MSAAPILMPKLGLTMTEGLLAEWRVGPGDAVEAGDVLFVVETDKIANEVEARAAGRIEELRLAEGETASVGAVVATWTGPAQGASAVDEESADAPDEAPPSAPPPTPENPATSKQPADASAEHKSGAAESGARIIATPLARRMAREAGIALENITGSGPRGRIKACDVTAAAESEGARSASPAPNMAAPAGYSAMAEVELTALEQLRRNIAEDTGREMSVHDFAALAIARLRPEATEPIGLTEAAGSRTVWVIPTPEPGEAARIAVGAVRLQWRGGEDGRPVERPFAALTIAGNSALLPTEEGVALLEAVAGLLETPLKLLV